MIWITKIPSEFVNGVIVRSYQRVSMVNHGMFAKNVPKREYTEDEKISV